MMRDNTLKHLAPALAYTIVTIVIFGLIYPVVMTAFSQLVFPWQANGSMVYVDGTAVGSRIIGELWTKPQYFHGRPSAAGTGYDPTSTGATNLGPTSKKLVEATEAAIAQVKKENPQARGPVPPDLVTSSGSGIDPDISPDAAYYQAPRIAKARGIPLDDVLALIASHVRGRTLGFLGEPRVNVLELNMALDGMKK
jgi:K+-transporting ATPase ATPase C chain